MKLTESVELDAAPDRVYPLVVELHEYPRWLRLVHSAEPIAVAPDEPPAWDVELRARVGPFARSKRLRMGRTEAVPGSRVRFERAEVDRRDHAAWRLHAELAPIAAGTLLTMHLSYDGGLWTGGLMERALYDEIERGRRELARLLGSEPRRID